MNMPGFHAEASLPADSSLLSSVRIHPMIGFSAALGDADKVVLQQLPACVDSCQQSWGDCIGRCQWWEWVIGSCVPKCRVEWVICMGRC